MITLTTKLTGQALIDHVSQNTQPDGSKAELCKAAGYVKELSSGGIGADFVGFYEALLEAKKEANPELFDTSSEYQDYDSLSDEIKELYDDLEIGIGRTWTHEETPDFIELLDEIGVETKEQFNDAFDRYIEGTWNAEAQFAEELVTEIEHNITNSLVFHAIDWQAVWEHQLKYDYNSIEFDGAVYFFRNC